ncbi:hypothetical protein [Peribacillus frigoritolerans]|uniref:hypothetical protein n=1 Tax=Peribacillus frigoritolerans TaxID=450367 RepID=UPI001059858E|nr:hypothetical protein [Peribacillus frigoritolerans]TDL83113.1 hypothetical protein E2R53_06185 [Peribacillus frigoritolerans]
MTWKKKCLTGGMALAIMLGGLTACGDGEQDEMNDDVEEEVEEETDGDIIDEDNQEMEEEGQ